MPRSLELQTIERALLSAAMDTCELDSGSLSYRPYMQKLRASRRYSDKQIAYVGLLHGVSSGHFGGEIGDLVCNEEMVADMKRTAASDPVKTP